MDESVIISDMLESFKLKNIFTIQYLLNQRTGGGSFDFGLNLDRVIYSFN